MLSAEDVMQLIQSLIWLLAGVGVFIVGMNYMSDALEKSAGEGMKKLEIGNAVPPLLSVALARQMALAIKTHK